MRKVGGGRRKSRRGKEGPQRERRRVGYVGRGVEEVSLTRGVEDVGWWEVGDRQ